MLVGLLIFTLCIPSFAKAEGLASKYEGDKGIKNDPDVVFVENFEEGSLDAVRARWENVKNIGIMSLSTDVPSDSTGKYSLLVTHVGGKGTGGDLYRRLSPGYEQLYVRFYVKFDPDCYPIHHFFHVGGYNPATPWPQGGAGIQPAGNERFTTGVEPYGSKWRWDFYSYWMRMRSAPGGNFWGNDFINDENLKVERGKWICVELMMRMNKPVTEFNGEQALWINGKPWSKDGQIISHFGKEFPKGRWIWDSFIPDPSGAPFEGFRWRSAEELKLNFLWVLLYITGAPPGRISKVWFDDIVVATKYIGPYGSATSVTDFNGDGKVDFKDFSQLALYWLQTASLVDLAPQPFADGVVDFKDLAVLAENWLNPWNQPSMVYIIVPPNGAKLYLGRTVEIEADASDADGSVVKAEFFADASKVAEDNDGIDGW